MNFESGGTIHRETVQIILDNLVQRILNQVELSIVDLRKGKLSSQGPETVQIILDNLIQRILNQVELQPSQTCGRKRGVGSHDLLICSGPQITVFQSGPAVQHCNTNRLIAGVSTNC